MSVRWPAEFEPADAIWLSEPTDPETWPGCLDDARAQWHVMRDAMQQAVSVRVTQTHRIPTNDAWLRDFGPITVLKHQAPHPPQRHAQDFRFNVWGNKYEPRPLDDAAAVKIAQHEGIPATRHDLVLEGGSIDTDGRGTLLTTEQCLLNPNRNPSLTRSDLEAKLHETLGVTRTLWLPGGISGDDTDGHVDDVARFLAPGLIACVAPPPHHPDHAMGRANLAALQGAKDALGESITMVPLPAPQVRYRYPGDDEPTLLPASYANFVFANDRLFVPVFNQPEDEPACRSLDDALPGHTIVPIRAEHLVAGLGGPHCLSMQVPLA